MAWDGAMTVSGPAGRGASRGAGARLGGGGKEDVDALFAFVLRVV